MPVLNALAGLAVLDIRLAADWYERLFGGAGTQPMAEVMEWSLPRGGALQIFVDAGRAGRSSVTLSVTSIEELVARLQQHGVVPVKRSASPSISTAVLQDPDGNQVVLAEQHSPDLVR